MFVGQVVLYWNPDEPEGGMIGTILKIEPPDEPPDDVYGRNILLELHNWGDKSASEVDVFPIYRNDKPLMIEDIRIEWEERNPNETSQ